MARRLSAAAASKQIAEWMELEDGEDGAACSDREKEVEGEEEEEETEEEEEVEEEEEEAEDEEEEEEDMEDEEEQVEVQPSTHKKQASKKKDTGRNGVIWSADVPPPSRVRACNIRHTRERQLKDKFAPFHDMWDQFIVNCQKNYSVGSHVTFDEQLIPFRGRCHFKQCMPSKPDKYGMKLFLLCDCATVYTFNGMPYLGQEGEKRHVGLAVHVVETLCTPLHNSGVNVTTDNCFTSTDLDADLLLKITLLGTMSRNKSAIPVEF